MTKFLMHVKNEYGVDKVYMTENGAFLQRQDQLDGEVLDYNRIDYLRSHFIAAHKAMEAGGQPAGLLRLVALRQL